jgi:hypothetical protein
MGAWPQHSASFSTAKLCQDGTVEWNGLKVGLWWKDDFVGYHFSPYEAAQQKVKALTKSEFRIAVSANISEFRKSHANS